ncbi:hypothetical protein ACPXCS_38280 [Streptomyces sp. DT190]|uniref:hypothetical protein n=1 Tax=unclassified Streptomyces TaxID=2593676 RepID=UPI003CF92F26
MSEPAFPQGPRIREQLEVLAAVSTVLSSLQSQASPTGAMVTLLVILLIAGGW